MAASKRSARRGRTLGLAVLAVGSSAVFDSQAGWASLWPSAVALVLVFVSRSAFCGLLVGALCGSILIADSAAGLGPVLVDEQFLPIPAGLHGGRA